ncbi:TPA: hypothetical protein ACGAZF_000792 [Streptococcus agalactiae]
MEKITNDFEKVIAVLNQLSISYELVENGPVLLTEQADNFKVHKKVHKFGHKKRLSTQWLIA